MKLGFQKWEWDKRPMRIDVSGDPGLAALMMRFTAAAALVFALGSYTASAVADAPCDGAYKSWGQGCDGGAYIRRDTIEWHSPWSVCKATPYEVIDSKLEGDQRRVAYKLKKLSKACRYQIIEISEGKKEGDYWSINGYPTLEAYEKRGDDAWIAAGEGRTGAWCPVILETPQTRCNLNFARRNK
ncbi:hypothetical protein QTH90_24765 [Variovorax sp. J2P1-59]|uniref:hypothetical protein n=1 Tax=Variovorax flavidus TaxID=3053501 RepID=UPI00257787E1|nr:hypothetical protein [Variovorax sp. J2P1-59]MDM0077643.1 hypothetical protein [Variovorax sp. J2P1-59]